jgi:transcriptional regulator with XRE-family HTH domain
MPGSVIRQYRELRNYSQDYVAKQMGISQNAYSKIENGITQLTVNHVKQLSRILEASLTDLLKDEFEIHNPVKIKPHHITKEILMNTFKEISDKLNSKIPEKHAHYPVVMALLHTIDTTIEEI